MKSNGLTKREELLRAVYSDAKTVRVLKTSSHLAVCFSVLLFAYFCYKAISLNLTSGIVAVACCGVAFLVVSGVRAFINAPRPYEVLAVFDAPPKNRKGHSFPSRHVFSVFCIATVCAPILPHFALLSALLGLLLAASRVLLGIHFIRDVVAGGAIGVASGFLAALAAGLFWI